MLQNFLFKSLLKSKLKDVPQEQQNKIIALVEKNPDFFKKVAEKIQQKIKSGVDQQAAVLSVMQEFKDEIGEMMK